MQGLYNVDLGLTMPHAMPETPINFPEIHAYYLKLYFTFVNAENRHFPSVN